MKMEIELNEWGGGEGKINFMLFFAVDIAEEAAINNFMEFFKELFYENSLLKVPIKTKRKEEKNLDNLINFNNNKMLKFFALHLPSLTFLFFHYSLKCKQKKLWNVPLPVWKEFMAATVCVFLSKKILQFNLPPIIAINSIMAI